MEDGDLPKQLLAKLRDSLSLAAEPPPTPAAQPLAGNQLPASRDGVCVCVCVCFFLFVVFFCFFCFFFFVFLKGGCPFWLVLHLFWGGGGADI